MSIPIKSPNEVSVEIAKKAKEKRLKLNLSQQSLSKRAGVSYSSLKNFEQKGKVSLESLLKIALALDALDSFEFLFTKAENENISSIDELLVDKSRKRGRK